MPGTPGKEHASGEIDVEGRPASWVRDGDLDGRPLVLLGHGAGAPYTSSFMAAAATGLAARDCSVVRFHFPYMEKNASDRLRRPPDRQPVLLATVRAMLRTLDSWGPGQRRGLVLAGKSMGGRMMSLLLAEDPDVRADGAFYLGYPLHPPGNTRRLRAEHLPAIKVPQLFVSGTRDTLCDLELLRPILERLRPQARLHIVEGGDHSLATSRRDPLAGSAAWLDVAASFVHEVTSPGPSRP